MKVLDFIIYRGWLQIAGFQQTIGLSRNASWRLYHSNRM